MGGTLAIVTEWEVVVGEAAVGVGDVEGDGVGAGCGVGVSGGDAGSGGAAVPEGPGVVGY